MCPYRSQDENEWLCKLEKGHQIVVHHTNRPPEQGTVARVTKTLIVDTRERRWRRSDGGRIGNWDPFRSRIGPMTDELAHQFEHERLLSEVKREVRDMKFGDIDPPTLAQVAALLGVR